MPTEPSDPAGDLRTDRAHSARVYDYILGGKDNYAVDRATGDATVAAMPSFPTTLRANRAFMHRAARYVAGLGVRQFLDIGTGIPTEPNLHQVVQQVAPESRVVYVDNDPIVLAHAGALMVSDPRGATAYLQADARDPASVLDAPVLRDTLDLGRPVALSLIALLHFLDDAEAVALLRAALDVLRPGSYVALSHFSADPDPAGVQAAVDQYARSGVTVHPRGRDDIARLFLGGLDPVDPGVVIAHRWRPDSPEFDDVPDSHVAGYAVVARVV